MRTVLAAGLLALLHAPPQDPPAPNPPGPVPQPAPKPEPEPAPAAEPAVPALGTLNARILETLRAYPTDGTHAFYWPKSGPWGGNTKDLHYGGSLFAAGDEKKRCYCCGLTFEVFLESWGAWCASEKRELALPGIADHAALREFRKRWFGSDGDKTTMQHALVAAKLGVKIAKLEDAEPGDFVQLWRNDGTGHAVIFLAWVREKRAITGLRYWSSQKSTNGIGERTEAIGTGEKEIDRRAVHIARVGAREVKHTDRSRGRAPSSPAERR